MASLGAGDTNPGYLDTLAAAYAEAGRYPEAVRAADKALAIAIAAGQEGLARVIREHRELYRANRPLRVPSA
jgi:hypothetical protein